LAAAATDKTTIASGNATANGRDFVLFMIFTL
jgi:hypothetical protein